MEDGAKNYTSLPRERLGRERWIFDRNTEPSILDQVLETKFLKKILTVNFQRHKYYAEGSSRVRRSQTVFQLGGTS